MTRRCVSRPYSPCHEADVPVGWPLFVVFVRPGAIIAIAPRTIIAIAPILLIVARLVVTAIGALSEHRAAGRAELGRVSAQACHDAVYIGHVCAA